MDKLILTDDVLEHVPHLLPHEQLCFSYGGRPATIERTGQLWMLFVQIDPDTDVREWLREIAARNLAHLHVVSAAGAQYLCALSRASDFADCPDFGALLGAERRS